MRQRLLSTEQEEEFKRDYPYYSTRELADRYGMTYKALKSKAYRMHLKKDPETSCFNKQEARKRTMRSERRRLLFGLPQETNYVIHTNPKKVHLRDCHRYKSRIRGYLESEDKTTFYYNAKTRRSVQHEENGMKKYGFKYLAS